MSWSRQFDTPIELPGKTLSTLRDAATYIQRLPKTEQSQSHWQDAVAHLIRAAERSEAWVQFAEMFMLRALNHGQPPELTPPRKKAVRKNRIIS